MLASAFQSDRRGRMPSAGPDEHLRGAGAVPDYTNTIGQDTGHSEIFSHDRAHKPFSGNRIIDEVNSPRSPVSPRSPTIQWSTGRAPPPKQFNQVQSGLWRKAIAFLESRPLPEESRQTLDELKGWAREEEINLAERLAQERQAREEQLRYTASVKHKLSQRVLNLRKVQTTLAKQSNYAEAARVRNEADDLEEAERAQHALDVQRQLAQLNNTLVKEEQVAIAAMHKSIYEKLWQLGYHSSIPLHLLQNFAPPLA